MAFEVILGQEKLIENLKRVLKTGKAPHAYLLEGSGGLGKGRLALQWAKGLCCRGEGEKPCNHCISCNKFDTNNHPEVKWVCDEKSIKIEAIRDLQKELQMKPYEGDKKVYIIKDAEKMTLQAQNAILKTLEEPPHYGTIIMTTTNGNSLLPTITSRCQRLKLLPASSEKIYDYLINKKQISPEEAKVVSAFSDGRIGKALQLLEDEGFKERRRKVSFITRSIIDKKTIHILENVEYFYDEKEYIHEILELFIGWYRDLLIYKDTGNKDLVVNIDEIEEIIYQTEKITLHNIREMIFIIEETKNNFRSNVNLQMNLEVMLLKLKERVN
ncbi:MAG: DNA polymerase III subunit delta' [Clostridiaceae bacterium]|nr:DNA polymerase III subunit delta' [Clostridiaceae bacterium]